MSFSELEPKPKIMPYSSYFIYFFFLAQSFLSNKPNYPNNTSGITLKILSYNIHYEVGMDGKRDIQRIVDVIKDLQPDIVGLQEVSDQLMTDSLARLTGLTGVFGVSTDVEPPNLYHLLGIPVPEAQLHYGDAILCKLPFSYVGNQSIPSASSSRYEAMAIDIEIGSSDQIRFINTHFDYLETIGSKEARKAAIEVIEGTFLTPQKQEIPAILTGDLNATPESAPLRLLEAYGWVTKKEPKLFTVPVKEPIKQIDYVLVRPQKYWKIKSIEVIDEPVASDHLPILMTVELLTF